MLYVIGMPIGDIEDMPPKNLNMLKNAKHIIAENEDNLNKILSKLKLDITANLIYLTSQKNGIAIKPKEIEILPILKEILTRGEDVCLISDDGMPGVADPGSNIIRWCHENGFKVSATPGPSSLIAAVTASGCGHNFRFHSFFETDRDRRSNQIKGMKDDPAAQIVMLRNAMGFGQDAFVAEIQEVLPEIIKICGDREATLCYNLTMVHETLVRGKISYLLEYHMKHRDPKDYLILAMEGSRG
jgi:16S rRNA (cytidine1402-2'-O)-methyltransferase